jgi:hypothetical protein
MFEVFDDEIEALIKEGIANLYWYKADLRRVWLRSQVPVAVADQLFSKRDSNGQALTKRQLMEELYLVVRGWDLNPKLEISRNFVRVLLEHESFAPQDSRHNVDRAEMAAHRLREIVSRQRAQHERRDRERRTIQERKKRQPRASVGLDELKTRFYSAMKLTPQSRGYELEKIFPELMRFDGIQVHEPFKIVGEQIDGAVKYEGHFYLIELRWREKQANQQDIAGLCMKVEGKMGARGLFIAMNGYTTEVLESLPKGKNLTVLLLDGCHLTNVFCGIYSFSALLERAIQEASLKGNLYCPHNLT